MSYTALYRKFRPQVFDEVKGQDAIVTTLKNQILSNRIGHAYLFCGTRGTGKTSVAKIFARAVNCENPKDGSPCGTCAVCRAVAEGRSLNVIEMDAASNNGVDTIRDIRDRVTYSPTEGKYAVYIIDEAHMLTDSASNALLKTLEEPPSYVIFILATTDVQKISDTILSRCQRYDFRRITIDTITDRLSELLQKEGITAEERAVRYVAKLADGSMRDAISLLDQAIAFYLGQELTYDRVLSALGATDTEVFSRLFRAVRGEDVKGALSVIDEIVSYGRDIPQFVNDFCWYLRNLLLMKSSDDLEELLDISGENLAALKEEADSASTETLMRYIRVFSTLYATLRNSAQKRILTEMAVIRLMKPEAETDLSSLLERMDRLEKKLEEGVKAAPAAPVYAAAAAPDTAAPSEAKKAPMPKAVAEEILEAVRHWKEIVSMMDNIAYPARTALQHAHLSVSENNHLQIVIDDDIAYGMCTVEEVQNEIRNALAKKLERTVEIEIRHNDSGRPAGEIYPDLQAYLQETIHMQIEIED